ncbi:hypothetical protein T459_28839 [Capsicum annuum]|uniref:Uncharacterized protein n=1 Tax=Capsicum annuum TaxID=4072 RepID=A0A2G2YHX3_CAPAN|nr:hypothetical protein T459_28839 [Capsicum annuum]
MHEGTWRCKGDTRKSVLGEDFIWEEVTSYSEMNMLLTNEINILKRKCSKIQLVVLLKMLELLHNLMGSASWTSVCWLTCNTSCVFYLVWSDNKGIKLSWGYNISYRDNPCFSFNQIGTWELACPLADRRDALQSTSICLREGFRRKDQNSSASSSEGCGSSVKHSSSADGGHLGNATIPFTGDGSTWNNIEEINSDKTIDS